MPQDSAKNQTSPMWLSAFQPDRPWRKAALLAHHRELLTSDQAFLTADVILWGGVCRGRDEKELERTFARILWLGHGVRWADHPLALKGLLK